MDTLALPPPSSASGLVLAPGRTAAPSDIADHPRTLHRVALAALLLATFGFRLWGVAQGLPYSYNSDEALHFVPRAIAFFAGSWNPHYFLNPPAYSYELHIAFELWFGGGDAAVRAYAHDPTQVFVVARVLAALLGTLAVGLTYLAAARLWDRTVALLAAAIFGLAFLPVFYSHLALNDVPTLAPVALALWGVAGVATGGRRRDYLVAGAAIGFAAATKYTGGIVTVPLLAATVIDARSRPRGGHRAAGALTLALLAALAGFTLGNPYWIFDLHAFTSGVSAQASAAAGGEPTKLGISPGGGIAYYLQTFTWGFGLAPALAALAGVGTLVLRRRLDLLAVLVPGPIAFILFMGTQQRYFGRWLMPIFPMVAILAAIAGVELARWLARRRLVPLTLATTGVVLLLLSQSVLSDVHDDRVLSRPQTTNLVRAWMVRHIPPGQKIVVEPVIPDNWADDIGVSGPWTATGARWYLYPTSLSTIGPDGRALPDGRRRFVPVDEYERVLRPSLIPQYENEAYCWVITGSLQSGRAFVSPRQAPGAIAYYHALARDGRLVDRVSPFAPGTTPAPFNFDFSIDYLPHQYRLPGPVMSVYHLTGGRCR